MSCHVPKVLAALAKMGRWFVVVSRFFVLSFRLCWRLIQEIDGQIKVKPRASAFLQSTGTDEDEEWRDWLRAFYRGWKGGSKSMALKFKLVLCLLMPLALFSEHLLPIYRVALSVLELYFVLILLQRLYSAFRGYRLLCRLQAHQRSKLKPPNK